jgi:DNA-binding transcriptional ArsR family regulator
MAEAYSNRAEIQYTISNDIRCPAPFSIDEMFDWRTDPDPHGFTGVYNVVDLSTIGGELSGYVLTDSPNTYIEQPIPKVSITPSVNRIDIVLRVKSELATQAKIQFMKSSNDDTSPEVLSALGQEIVFDLITDGNTHLYKIDPTPIESWQGLVTHFRIFPGLTMNPGDSFYIQFMRVMTKNVYTTCICDESDLFYEAPAPCTGAGRGFSIEGIPTKNAQFNVGEGNDTLTIKSNGSNTRTIVIPHTEYPIAGSVLAETIETKINQLSGFGFENIRFQYLKNTAFRIEGGIRGAHTTLEILFEQTSVLRSLGFFDLYGRSLYTNYPGVDDTVEPEYFTVNNNELKAVREGTLANCMTFSPENPWVEIGNPFYNYPPFYTTYDGRNKTLIDYLKPATASGWVQKLYFSGTVFENPQTKIKLFRPTENNGLKFIDEFQVKPVTFYNLPKLTEPPLPMNQVRYDYSVDVDLYIQEGDFLGIYNAIVYGDFVVDLTIGSDIDENVQRIMRSFLAIDGDLQEDIVDTSILEVHGESLTPLPIYGKSDKLKRKTSFFIDLGEKKAVDKVLFNYRVLEFVKTTNNLASEITTVDVDTHGGTHTHWRYVPTFSGLEQTTVTHTTTAYNRALLVDGNRESYNADETAFFWLDGDGELSNTDFQAPGIVQSKTFQKDRFDIQINLSQTFDKKVGAINLWFVEHQNWTQYGIFYKKGSEKKPFVIKGVSFDDKPTSSSSIYLKNPLVTPSSITDSDYAVTAAGISVPHKKMAITVEPVETKTVIFEVYEHHSTKMAEIELLSTELVSDGGYEIKGSDMFTIYVAEEDFEFREVGFFTDNVVTIGEVNTSIIDIGKPVRYMKVEVEPLVIMDLYNVKVLSEKKDHLTPKASYLTSSTEETTLHLDYEEERVLQIENKLNVNADILVDILRSDDSSRRETVVKCKLDSVESLELPEVGPSARYSLNQDVELKIRYDVAQDRPCYGTYSLNANNNGASDWVSLGTRVTDGNSPDAIDAPIGKDSESDDSQVFYSGLAVSGGVYNETYDITYTVVIDTTNGVAAGYGSGQVPTFTVTSSPDVDDVNTPTEILEYGVFYSVGTKGVLIKFEDVALFGSTDIFIIRARATAEALTSVNAKEYGHVAVDLQEFFEIEDIVIEGSAERITQDISVYWSDSLDWESASSGNTSNIYGVQFRTNGHLGGEIRWVKLDWNFTQIARGGTLDNILVYVNKPIFYSDYWWSIYPLGGGASEVDREIHSGNPVSLRSLKFHYLSPGTEVGYTLSNGEIATDPFWSFRDFLTFMYYCSDSSGIEQFKIRIGTDSENYYEWQASLSSSDNSWVQMKLKFEEGTIIGEPELYKAIGYFNFSVNSSKKFSINLDTLKITRNKFEETVKNGKGLYLNNREFLALSPIDRLSLREGALDFWMKSDFDSHGHFEHTETFDSDTLELTRQFKYYFDERENTSNIISLIAGLDFKLFLVAQPGLNGLFLATNNFLGENAAFVNRPSFSWDDNIHHVGIAWKYDGYSMNVQLELYIDGSLAQVIYTPWIPTREDAPVIILGGVGDSKLFSIYPTAANAAIENLRVFNFYRKDFDYLMSSEEVSRVEMKTTDLFSISLDNGGYVEYGSPSLPLVVENIAPGDKVDFSVRFERPPTDIPSTLPRRARVEVKWRPR